MTAKRLLLGAIALVTVACSSAGPGPAPPERTAPSEAPAASTAATGLASAPGHYWPAEEWHTSTPEEQGMDSGLLVQMLESVRKQQLNLHSVLVVRHGYIVLEAYFHPYRQDTRHELYSCTKSFTSALIGIAVGRGDIAGLDRSAASFFAGRSFLNLDRRKRAMTLEHLLTMTSGLDWEEGDAIYRQMYKSGDWVRFVLDRPMAAEPGERFNYCSGCSHVLSAIVEEATGMSTLEFARQRLFEPLGIRGFRWETDAQGIPIGGWGLKLTPRDMARFGYLYLHQGSWAGKQVISAGWVQRSIGRHVETDGDLDYGYQWWIDPALGGYAALGRDGQTIFVVPDLDLVIVFTAEVDGHDAEFGLIRDHVVPAARSAEPLPANPTGQARLRSLVEAASQP